MTSTPGGTALPDYSPASTSAGPLPSDQYGDITIWNTPTGITSSNMPAFLKTSIWFDNGQTANGAQQQAQSRLARANPGDNVAVDKTPTVGSYDIPASVEDIYKQYAAMSASVSPKDQQTYQELQKGLADAGFYGSATSIQGGWNGQTETALGDALVHYLQVSESTGGVGVSFKEWLAQTAQQNAANGNAFGAGGTGSSAPVLSDPDTLRRYAQEAAQAALGRNLTPNQLDTFVSQFHNQQIQSYTDAANHNGLSSQKDDPRASAVSFVTGSNQQEFGQHQIQGYTDAFLNMFLPSSSSAPNVPVDPSAVSY